jgi:hypothetical protein
MSKLVGATVALLLVVTAVPARALNWSLGANLGLSIISPDNGDNVTMFSWPSGGLLTLFTTPGLRVGFTGQNPQHEIYIDTGLSLISSNGASLNTLQMSGNYQYNFGSSGNLSPYLTAGVGFASYSESDGGSISAISPMLGGGLGLRHKMGNGHGTLRAEARLDHLNEGEDSGFVVISAANTFGIKLGFDLWDK